MTVQSALPGLEVGGHACGPLCTAEAHGQHLTLAREPLAVLAARVRISYLQAGIRLSASAPVQPPFGHRPIRTEPVTWLVSWAR